MTWLRQHMREDMQLRGLAPRTQQAYLAAVRQLAVHYDQSSQSPCGDGGD